MKYVRDTAEQHERLGLSLSGSDVKNFLLNSLTFESSGCASNSGKTKEKLNRFCEGWDAVFGLTKIKLGLFHFYHNEREITGH